MVAKTLAKIQFLSYNTHIIVYCQINYFCYNLGRIAQP